MRNEQLLGFLGNSLAEYFLEYRSARFSSHRTLNRRNSSGRNQTNFSKSENILAIIVSDASRKTKTVWKSLNIIILNPLLPVIQPYTCIPVLEYL